MQKIGAGARVWHWVHICSKVKSGVSVYDCVELEDDVFCGPSMVFTNVVNPRAHIERKSEYKKTLVKKGSNYRRKCESCVSLKILNTYLKTVNYNFIKFLVSIKILFLTSNPL